MDSTGRLLFVGKNYKTCHCVFRSADGILLMNIKYYANNVTLFLSYSRTFSAALIFYPTINSFTRRLSKNKQKRRQSAAAVAQEIFPSYKYFSTQFLDLIFDTVRSTCFHHLRSPPHLCLSAILI